MLAPTPATATLLAAAAAAPTPSGAHQTPVPAFRVRSYEANGGCNTCYGGDTIIGPNCNSTVTIACSKFSCFCA